MPFMTAAAEGRFEPKATIFLRVSHGFSAAQKAAWCWLAALFSAAIILKPFCGISGRIRNISGPPAMVTRSIEVYDNDFMTVAAGSPSLTPGSPIANNSDTPDGTIFQFSGGSPVTVTLDDTSANTDVLEDDDYANHTIIDGAGVVATSTGVESESYIFVRALDDFGNATGPKIAITVFSQDNITQNIWSFHSDTPLVAGTQYVKIGGDNIGSTPYSSIQSQPVCYSEGTLINTPSGRTVVELLKPDDLVWTLDNGPVPVRWTRSEARRLDSIEADQKPILISAGALGSGIPTQDLIVSPQHRILVGGHQQLHGLFETEAFAPVKSLTSLPGIRYMNGKKAIRWIHFACERHEVVFANGCLSESLLLGPMVVNGMTAHERQAVSEIFGMAPTTDSELNGPSARECLSVGAIRRQIAKCLEANKKLVEKEIRKWDLDLAMEQYESELMRSAKAMEEARGKSAA